MAIQQKFVLMTILAWALTPALAQTPASTPIVIDAALLAKANSDDAASQVKVGDAYAAGSGADRTTKQLAADYKLAADWYRKAAEKGNLAGQIHLAELYRDGKGVPRDPAQSADWYTKAAQQGDAGAQGTLGLLYSMGQGVDRNYAEAYFWLDLAAAVKGPKQAQYAANRQMVGAHITADELADVQDRIDKWKSDHPR